MTLRRHVHNRLDFATTSGIMARTGERVRKFLCGLHGHDPLLHFDGGRLSLLCTSCSYESPGWDLHGSSRPAAPVAVRQVAAIALVGEHRAA